MLLYTHNVLVQGDQLVNGLRANRKLTPSDACDLARQHGTPDQIQAITISTLCPYCDVARSVAFGSLDGTMEVERETTQKFRTIVDEMAERKRAEQALHESEERFRFAQKVASIGTFDWNIETGVNNTAGRD